MKYADGGQLNNNLNPKYNNYLNMRQYAQGGDLTRFDEGGTHESSPLGGIPQGIAPDGKQNTVEQGESKKGNFIYSNRIALDKELVKQFNLPSYVAGKSVSDASKVIDDKFKHRADKYAQETKNTLLDRLSQAQEYLKQQEQASLEQANQSMQANSQEIPDQMNGQIPDGMEEYAQQESQQSQDIQNIQTQSPIAAFGGYQQKRFDWGGDKSVTDGEEKPWITGVNPKADPYVNAMNSIVPAVSSAIHNQSAGTSNKPQERAAVISGINAAGSTIGQSIGGEAGGAIGKGVSAATGLYSLGREAFGSSDIKGNGLQSLESKSKWGSVGSGAMQGAATGATIGSFFPGPGTIIGGAIGGIVGAGAGFIGGNKDEKAVANNNRTYGKVYNSQFDNYHAFGGELGDPPLKKVKNPDGSYSMVGSSTKLVTPGQVGTVIPGTPGKPAVLPTTGVNSTDAGRNKAFAAARAAGLPTFTYNGKVYTTEISGTPGKPAVPATPDIVTPSVPPVYETIEVNQPIPNQVYNVQAQRGTAGTGVLRPGIGGGITTNNQYTANKETAERAINAQQVYNADVNKRYSQVADDGRSSNSAQVANRNAKAELRRQQLQGTATATEIPTQLGLERKKVGELRQGTFALGGNMNQYVKGGPKITSVGTINPINTLIQSTNELPVGSSLPDEIKQVYQPNFYNKMKGYAYNAGENIGKFASENAGDIMRLSPIAMNAYQLNKLKKPQGFQYNTLNNRYVPQYVDEAQMQRVVDQEGNNTIAAISQMGGSEGATRNAILAAGLNKTKGLSDAYANAAAQNRAQNAQAQQFNLGVDVQNVAANNRAIDEMRADQGAYDSAKSKYLSSIGTDIGEIGKEKNAADAAIAMFGYTRKGKYVVDKNGNKVSPEELARAQANYATYISEQNKKANT